MNTHEHANTPRPDTPETVALPSPAQAEGPGRAVSLCPAQVLQGLFLGTGAATAEAERRVWLAKGLDLWVAKEEARGGEGEEGGILAARGVVAPQHSSGAQPRAQQRAAAEQRAHP